MTSALPQPVPKNLREQIVSFVLSAPEEDLPDLGRRLLMAERDQLWKEVQAQAKADFEAGKYDDVPRIIAEYRSRNKAR